MLISPQKHMNQLAGIDVLKFIGAILVVSIHTNPLLDISYNGNFLLVQVFARLAVPFFFMANGYLCFRKTVCSNFDTGIPIAFAWKMFKLYVVWSAIYGFQMIYFCVFKNESGLLHGALGLIRTVLFSGYEHLWYLHASVIAILLTTWTIKRNWSFRRILIAGFLLYGIGLLGDTYWGLIQPLQRNPLLWKLVNLFLTIIVSTRNGLFEGFLFVSLGAFLAFRKIYIPKNTLLLYLSGSLLCLIAEALWIGKMNWALDHNMYVFLVPASFFLFYCSIHWQIANRPCWRKLRTYSSWIYFTHWSLIPAAEWISIRLNGIFPYASLLRFFIVFMGSFALSAVLAELQSKDRFSWIKQLSG